MRKITLGISLVALLSFLLHGCDDDSSSAGPDAVTAEVEHDLLRLREEEKLARDVYLTLFDIWEVDIFEQISGSEQRHMDAVKVHLDELAIADPVLDDTVGVFSDSELGALYEQLVTQGQASEQAALLVGATIEDLDIYDIEDMMTRNSDPSIAQTYSRLLCGSGNHMRGFTAQLSSAGVVYDVQFISADYYAQILATEHQQCGQH